MRLADFRSQISDLRSQISDLGFQISDLRSQISDLGSQISDLRFQISDFRSQISDFRSQISDFRSQISDLRFQIFRRILMTDGEPPSAGITRSSKAHRTTLIAAQRSCARHAHTPAEVAWLPGYSGSRNDRGERRK